MKNSRFTIKLDGAGLKEIEDVTTRLVVESSLGLPSMFHIILAAQEKTQYVFNFIDSKPIKVGQRIEVLASADDKKPLKSLIEGTVTSIEPDFRGDGSVQLHVRGYDDSVRLTKGKKTRSFKEATPSNIISKIAQENSLTAQVDNFGKTLQHLFQFNQTDWEFIQDLAHHYGLMVYFRDKKLICKKVAGDRADKVILAWGENLHNFRPKISALSQVSDVVISGWDEKEKKTVLKTLSSADSEPFHSIGESSKGPDVIQKVTKGKASATVIDYYSAATADMQALSAGNLLAHTGKYVSAEGECVIGDPRILAGSMVTVKEVGKTFSGDYMVTTARHEFANGQYRVVFTIQGQDPETLSTLLGANSKRDLSRMNGVMPAIVTDNNDTTSANTGRVKVKYPWFVDSTNEFMSDWARIAVPGGGNERGIYFLPEINDEVLVAFENGDINRPYILGGLWNGKDKSPEATDKVVKDSKVNLRLIKTRSGHKIELDDTSGSEKITITDKSAENSIVLDTKNNAITIKSKADLTLEAGGNLILKSKKAFKVDSSDKVEISAMGAMKMDSKDSINLSDVASNKVALGKSGVEVQGLKLSLKGSTMTEIQGAIVKIN